MKNGKAFLVSLVMMGTFATVALAAPQTTCPVMGGPINKELYADHDGKRVYFCCAYCDGEFKKNPQMYLDTMKEQGQEPAQVPNS